MSDLTFTKLTEHVGAEVVGADTDRLLNDEAVTDQLLQALETFGVLVFPKLSPDPSEHVGIARRFGTLVQNGEPAFGIDGLELLAYDPAKFGDAKYVPSTFRWHWDGCHLPPSQHPQNAIMLTARQLGPHGEGTEFASSYYAYDLLPEDEKELFADVRVLHSLANADEIIKDDLTPEDLARNEAARVVRNAPLVWKHRSGRRSLVLGVTAQEVVGMDREAGRKLLNDLLDRATAPENVYRHNWIVGDTVIWNNRGVLHHALPYDSGSPREMLRTTLVGDEAMV